jgi:hypothetical protein
MLQASLIILPVLDKAVLCRAAHSITGKNHLRSTDAKNLSNPQAEILSILEDYGGHASDGQNLVQFGFIFYGTTNMVMQVPQLVGGEFIFSSRSNSDLLATAIVMGSLNQWVDAYAKAASRGEHLQKCFESIIRTLQVYSPNIARLRLK